MLRDRARSAKSSDSLRRGILKMEEDEEEEEVQSWRDRPAVRKGRIGMVSGRPFLSTRYDELLFPTVEGQVKE